MKIPFNRVTVVGDEWDYTRAVVESGQIGGGGVFSSRCESLLEQILGAPKDWMYCERLKRRTPAFGSLSRVAAGLQPQPPRPSGSARPTT